jgi:hypothetical protein
MAHLKQFSASNRKFILKEVIIQKIQVFCLNKRKLPSSIKKQENHDFYKKSGKHSFTPDDFFFITPIHNNLCPKIEFSEILQTIEISY